MDAVIGLLESWKPPRAGRRGQAQAAARRGARRRPHPPAPPPGRRAAADRAAPLEGARRARRPPSLRRLQRVLRALPRRLDDLQLRGLARRGADARGGAGGEAGDGLPQARAEGGRAGARRRLRLGQLPALGRDPARRQRRRDHPLAAAGGESAAAGRGRRGRRPGRDPRHGLPRPRRRALRRDRQHRHGRARRRRATSTSTRAPSPACSSRAVACSTTASRASATPTPRPAPSRSATSSPTPRRSTSRGCCWRSNGPGFVNRHVEELRRPTTPRPCATGTPAWTRTSTTRCAWPAPSASASGASTCARPAMASKRASPRSTRRAARWADPAWRFFPCPSGKKRPPRRGNCLRPFRSPSRRRRP